MRDVIVVGGGVIGLSIAHAVATEGKSVMVLDPGNAMDAASWAAAGMLAPQSEADRNDALFQLCAASLRIYGDWILQLQEQSGVDPEYQEPGLIYVANSEDSFDALRRRMGWQGEAGFDSQLLTPDEVRKMEPHLTLPIVGGIHMPGERQVTPRRLLEALRGACQFRDVEVRNGERVRGILRQNGKIEGVETDTESFSAAAVVIASGARSSEIAGLRSRLPIVPRKGQIFSLVTPSPMFQRLVRWEHAYMVQRRGGELVVGATNEDAGFDRSLTPSGIGGLLAQVQKLSSCTAGLAIQEMWTGLRPATPDGLPVLGFAGDGLIYATGHYRNGVLLAPITASIVASLVTGRQVPLPLEPYSARRFEV